MKPYRWTMIAFVVALAMPSFVLGQYRVEQGYARDANNMVGSGGFNYARPAYDFNAGNRIVSGNVPGGRAFQGFSPIRDPSSFGIGTAITGGGLSGGSGLLSGGGVLPSDRLTAFQRDSFNLADYRRYQTGTSALGRSSRLYGTGNFGAYYSPYSAVASTGTILAGGNRVGSSQLLDPYQATQQPGAGSRTNPLADSAAMTGGRYGAVQTRLVRMDTGSAVTGRANDALLRSPLFSAAYREVPVSELADEARSVTGQAGAVAPASLVGPIDVRTRGTELVDRRVGDIRVDVRSPDAAGSTRLDRVFQRASQERGFAQAGGQADSASDKRQPAVGRLSPPRPGRGELAEAGNVFGRMQDMSQRRLLRPITPVGAEAAEGKAAAQTPGGLIPGMPAGGPTAQPARPAGVTAEADLGVAEGNLLARGARDAAQTPTLSTFVGTEDSALNRHLAYAEQSLKQGRFYRAAEAYDLARTIDAGNPLPYLGRSLSLLAAGDYVTSVGDLFEAVQRYKSLGMFQIDLKAFMPDVTVIDSRRADLERTLKANDDARLRFLLGFAEYSSGLEKFGLKNMELALAGEQAASRLGVIGGGQFEAIRQFVEVLKSRTEGFKAPVGLPEKK